MKQKSILLLVVVAILLTGCVVKSLKPFYTEETVVYDVSLIGKWEDDKKGTWVIIQMKKALETRLFNEEFSLENRKVKVEELQSSMRKIKQGNIEVKSEELVIFDNNKPEKNTYKSIDSVILNGKITLLKQDKSSKDGELSDEDVYLISYKEQGEDKTGAFFRVVPFKIKGQLFLDFTPFNIGGVYGLNDFAGMHYVGIHTLAKLNKKGDELEISWLSESKIQELFEQKKIRIAHEKVGVENDEILLTASSEELQKFIAKYMDSPDAEKWTTSVKRTLKRIK